MYGIESELPLLDPQAAYGRCVMRPMLTQTWTLREHLEAVNRRPLAMYAFVVEFG
jgi:hypothetical protein